MHKKRTARRGKIPEINSGVGPVGRAEAPGRKQQRAEQQEHWEEQEQPTQPADVQEYPKYKKMKKNFAMIQ